MENFTKLKELGEKELLLLDTQNFANNLVFAHTYFFSFLQVAATRYGGVFASILEDEIKGDQTHTEMILRDLGLSFNQLPITLLPEDPMQSFCKSCFGAIESRQLAEAFVAAVEQHAGEFFISLKKCFDKAGINSTWVNSHIIIEETHKDETNNIDKGTAAFIRYSDVFTTSFDNLSKFFTVLN